MTQEKFFEVEKYEQFENEERTSFNFQVVFAMIILNWQWFLLSIGISVSAAMLYLRYTKPVFQMSAKMLIKDEQTPRNSRNQMLSNMQDLGIMTNSAGIDNEVEVLQSSILAREVVKKMKLYVYYTAIGRVGSYLMYRDQPINVDIDPAHLDKLDEDLIESVYSATITFRKSGPRYFIEGTTYKGGMAIGRFERTLTSFPCSIRTKIGTLTFTNNLNRIGGRPLSSYDAITWQATIVPPVLIAKKYLGAMSVQPTSKRTSIAQITLKDQIPNRGVDFLRQLARCYNEQANEDKNEIAHKTEEFINDRLAKIDKELGSTEGKLEGYKKRNNVTQLQLDATNSLQQSAQFSDKLQEATSQVQLINYIREYVNKPSHAYDLIPSNIGIQDQSSTALIAEFNKGVLDRNRLLKSASEQAPQVLTLTSTLDELRSSIRTALMQALRSADIRRQSLANQYQLYQSKVNNSPEQERVLTQIGRQQEVKSGLYLMLLQKREENSISLAATADKGKLIDDPQVDGKVSPKSAIILFFSMILGVGLPFGILYLIQFLKYRIEGHDDVARLTNLPIVADVAVASESAKTAAGIVVHANRNDSIDEIFRSLRTNVQFMMKPGDKVILFTSSTSGEGKTFNAANLAVSFALLGKKVILCGFDIRKPALGRLFGRSDRHQGVSTLLVKNEVTEADVLGQIDKSNENENLDLLLAGPTPPNPAELLARENLKDIIDVLKKNYDYVILDTAPVGLVTDTLQVAKYANVCCYVVRADYTPKSNMGLLNSLVEDKKINNACIILNGVDISKKKYGYYYGYGKYGKYGRYGYGYGYGYGKYGRYGYGGYGTFGTYGNYSDSHYGNANDNSIKR